MNLCNTIRQEKDGFQDKIEKQQLIQLVKRVGSSLVRRPERITSWSLRPYTQKQEGKTIAESTVNFGVY